MKTTISTRKIVVIFCVFLAANASLRAQGGGLLPDLRTVVPQHLQIVNKQKREILRFSNGIANTGDGPLRMRAQFPLEDVNEPQLAIQEILDASGNVVAEFVVSEFEFHPEHNHWHINDVARFEVRSGSPTGSLVGNASVKVTFCLIDWYKLEGNSPTRDRTYFDCAGDYQGISVGWVDQYHQSLEGQNLDITGAPPGLYYLVSTTNPDGAFVEKDLSNNIAWVGFMLSRDSNGNPKIKIVSRSPCESDGLCGDKAPNR
jgi:hypothetical protein